MDNMKKAKEFTDKFIVPLDKPNSILKVSDKIETFDYEYEGKKYKGIRSIIQKPYSCWGLGRLIRITIYDKIKNKWAKEYTNKDVLKNNNELELSLIISSKIKGIGGYGINKTNGRWWGAYGCHFVRPKGTKSFDKSIDVYRSMILNSESHVVSMFAEPYHKHKDVKILNIQSKYKINVWSSVKDIIKDYTDKFDK